MLSRGNKRHGKAKSPSPSGDLEEGARLEVIHGLHQLNTVFVIVLHVASGRDNLTSGTITSTSTGETSFARSLVFLFQNTLL